MLVTDAVKATVGSTVKYLAPEPLGLASIRYFALAIGSDPTRWRHEAPPTLVCETNQLTGIEVPDEAGYLGHTWELPWPVPCAMIRGGNEYRFHRPARPDDVIATEWRLVSIEDRSRETKPLAIVEAEAVYRSADGEPIATNTETLIYRPMTVGAPTARTTLRTVSSPSSSSFPSPAAVAHDRDMGPEARARSTPVVGTTLPPLLRSIALVDLVAYGAATWDWHRLHYDDDFAASSGMASPVVDGQMLGALLAEQVIRSLEPGAFIERLRFRNRSPVLVGETIELRATVNNVDHERIVIDHKIVVGDRIVVDRAETVIRRP